MTFSLGLAHEYVKVSCNYEEDKYGLDQKNVSSSELKSARTLKQENIHVKIKISETELKIPPGGPIRINCSSFQDEVKIYYNSSNHLFRLAYFSRYENLCISLADMVTLKSCDLKVKGSMSTIVVELINPSSDSPGEYFCQEEFYQMKVDIISVKIIRKYGI